MTIPTVHQLGRKPELKDLMLTQLTIDARYQREISSRRGKGQVQRIAERFAWNRFQPPTVCARGDGMYLVIDGQHRVAAARLVRGLERVPCYIVHAPTIEEQADGFLAINCERVAVSQYALHKARLVAGDKTAKEIVRVCAAADVEVPFYPVPRNFLKPNQTLALGSIAGIIAKHGGDQAIVTLKLLRAAWPSEPGNLTAAMIRTVAELLPLKPEAFLNALRGRNAIELELTARQRAQQQGGTAQAALLEILREMLPANAVREATRESEVAKAPPAKRGGATTGTGQARTAKARASSSIKPVDLRKPKFAPGPARRDQPRIGKSVAEQSKDQRDADLIAKHLASKGATKVEVGGKASGMERVVRWMRAQDIAVVPQTKPDGRATRYQVDGRATLSAIELIAMANRHRKPLSLQPFPETLAKDNRHPKFQAESSWKQTSESGKAVKA